jgi:peptide chain release factor subunit 1
MAHVRESTSALLQERLEALALFPPSSFPVLSLYLDLTPDQRGQDDYQRFVRKIGRERLDGFPSHSAQRASFERDMIRIESYLRDRTSPSANGLAVFACSGERDFFETLQLEAPVGQHWLFIGATPHLYPLARLADRYPRYAAVVLDTHRARIFVFGLNALERKTEVAGEKTRRTAMGGWSQARYQRHADDVHVHNIREMVATLDRIVADEQIPHLIVAGNDVAVPLFLKELPTHLSSRLVDVAHADGSASESELLRQTLAVMQEKDAETDAARVGQLIDQWRSGGLGTAGPAATLRALELGQLDELLITANPDALRAVARRRDDETAVRLEVHSSAPQGPTDEARLILADDLVTRAKQTGARVRFIDDASLLADVGGVGGFLRFRL